MKKIDDMAVCKSIKTSEKWRNLVNRLNMTKLGCTNWKKVLERAKDVWALIKSFTLTKCYYRVFLVTKERTGFDSHFLLTTVDACPKLWVDANIQKWQL